RDGSFTAFAYRQTIRGKEVDGSLVRVKVRRGEVPCVDYAAARLAGEPTIGSETPVLPAEAAVLTVQAMSGLSGLVLEGAPELVVLRGDGRREDAWCWRVTMREGEEPLVKSRSFYVDTNLPRILYVGQHFAASHQPTTGIVQGWGMPAAPPWHPYKGNSNDLVLHAIPGISVHGTISGAPEAVFTDANGNFVLNSGSSGQTIAVDATFGRQGQGYRVDTAFSNPNDYLGVSSTAAVGSDISLTLTGSNSNFTEEMRVAQVDAAIAAVRARAFATQYIGTVSFNVALLPNVTSTGCGFFLGSYPTYSISLAKYNSATFWNCASHSVIGHEFGHAMLASLGITTAAQPAFHEGFADAYDNMMNDSNVAGPSQRTNGGNIRDDPRSQHINCQYPLTQHGTMHPHCGCFDPEGDPYIALPLTSGVWVRIRVGFKNEYGDDDGLDKARTLFGNWCLLTAGGDEQCQGLHPGSLLEVLNSMDSEDTTWIEIIETAFAEHNICATGPCTN
ncbi:MAG: hypothetical protein KF678_08510, partial [Phycisphaeraceae bacterium]|nr:hypothetical protein [Phycisphaeraceae bacterium]